MLMLYRVISILLLPIAPIFLKKRLKQGKECPSRYVQKLGKNLPNFANNPTSKTNSLVFWFCAASVGEGLSALSIIKELCERGHRVVITTTTLSSANLLTQKLPSGAIHAFTPIDSYIYLKRFICHFKPDVFVLVEEEFWPNMINLAQKHCKKTYFLNAKFSQASVNRWTRYLLIKNVFVSLLNGFDKIFASSSASHTLFNSLDIKYDKIKSLKYHTISNFTPGEIKIAQNGLNLALCNTVLALSTHKNEEEIILKAFNAICNRVPRPFLYLMPRHPERLDSIVEIVKSQGLKFAVFSKNDTIQADTKVLIVDKLGLVSTFCKLSKVVVMGGSLVEGIGGHNVLEPAYLEKPIITGPYNDNFADIVSEMKDKEAICVLHKADGATDGSKMADEITSLVVKCFQNSTFCRDLSANAKQHVEQNINAYKQICSQIEIV